MRGQECLAKGHKLDLAHAEKSLYQQDTFIWVPERWGAESVVDHSFMPQLAQTYAIRSYYYTSVVGDEPKMRFIREALWDLGFDPGVFKKTRKQAKAKGVDIALTKDVLSHAYLNNCEIVLLYAGDGDYVPLVEEVKRLGKLVYTAFFANWGMSDDLRLASDGFIDLEEAFFELWRRKVPELSP